MLPGMVGIIDPGARVVLYVILRVIRALLHTDRPIVCTVLHHACIGGPIPQHPSLRLTK